VERAERRRGNKRRDKGLILTNIVADASAAAARGPAKAKDAKLDIVEAAEGNGRDNGCRYHREEQQAKGNPKQH
jgi:hypothetical protein